MFLAILILTFAAALAVDIHHILKLRRENRPCKLLAAWMLFTTLAPFISMLVGALFIPDNTTVWMKVSIWVIWAWMLVVPRRVIFLTLARYGHRKAGYIVGAAWCIALLWGVTLGRTTIRVNRVEIASRDIPAGFDGVRFAQISDIHLGTLVCPERELTALADTINSLQPELLFFTGDLVNIRPEELDDRMATLLQRISAPVFSVTGNHDVGTYIKDSVSMPMPEATAEIEARQRAMGWNVLSDESCMLYRGGDSITLTGVAYDSDIRKHRHDRRPSHRDLAAAYRNIPDTLYNITLVHLPQLWDEILDLGYGDLTLAGHVHSMQMKLPLGKRGWSLAALMYRRWSGRYDERSATLYINDGAGYVGYPMRLGAYPEVTLFTLRRCE